MAYNPNYDYPDWVKFGLISSTIKYMVKNLHLNELPLELKPFVNSHSSSKARDWESNLMTRANEMTIEELQGWVDNMPEGFIRAEMRGCLNQRKASSSEA